MKFDSLGLPQEQGSSDLQDSSRLAGLMMAFKWPQFIDLRNYVIYFGKYVRHPREYRYTFSRDQTICLFAGLKSQDLSNLVDPNYKTEGDFVHYGYRLYFKKCAGLKLGKLDSWIYDKWVRFEIFYNAKFKQLGEPNKLICVLKVSGDQYLKLWAQSNKQWRHAIRNYWSENDGAWRGEPELAEFLIKKIEGIL